MSNHLTIGVYPNKSYKYNIVRDEDLQSHIDYNKIFRPGRLLYVDGELVYNGLIKGKYLKEFNNFVKDLMNNEFKDIDMSYATIPYE